VANTSFRRLKVALYYRRLHPTLSTTSQLVLRGNWLAEAGFGPGVTAVVEVEIGRLTITIAAN